MADETSKKLVETDKGNSKFVESNDKSGKFSEAREGFAKRGGIINMAPQTPPPPAPKADPPPVKTQTSAKATNKK